MGSDLSVILPWTESCCDGFTGKSWERTVLSWRKPPRAMRGRRGCRAEQHPAVRGVAGACVAGSVQCGGRECPFELPPSRLSASAGHKPSTVLQVPAVCHRVLPQHAEAKSQGTLDRNIRHKTNPSSLKLSSQAFCPSAGAQAHLNDPS